MHRGHQVKKQAQRPMKHKPEERRQKGNKKNSPFESRPFLAYSNLTKHKPHTISG